MMDDKNTARSGLFAQKGEAAPASGRSFAKQAAVITAVDPVRPSITDGEGAGLAGLIRRRKFNAPPAEKNILPPLPDPRAAQATESADPATTQHVRVEKSPLLPRQEAQPRIIPGGKRYQLTVRIGLKKYERFKQVALKSGRTNQEVLEEAVLEYLERHLPDTAASGLRVSTGENEKNSNKKGISGLISRTFS